MLFVDVKIKIMYDQFVVCCFDFMGFKFLCVNINIFIKYIDFVNEIFELFIILIFNKNIINVVKIKIYDQDVVDGCFGFKIVSLVFQNVNMDVYMIFVKIMVVFMYIFLYNYGVDMV